MGYLNKTYAITSKSRQNNLKDKPEIGFYPTEAELNKAWADWRKTKKKNVSKGRQSQ